MELSTAEKSLLEESRAYLANKNQPALVVPSNSEELIADRLRIFGFTKKEEFVLACNSFFDMLSYHIFGCSSHSQLMRKAISNQLKTRHPGYVRDILRNLPQASQAAFSEVMSHADYIVYCDGVADAVDGDLGCLIAAADLFLVKIVVIMDSPSLVLYEVDPNDIVPGQKSLIYRKVCYGYELQYGYDGSRSCMHIMVKNEDPCPQDENLSARVQELYKHLDDPTMLLQKCRDFLGHLRPTTISNVVYVRHLQRCKFYGFRILKYIFSDGECFFRCLGNAIYGNEDLHQHMREVVVARLKEAVDEYKELLLDKSKDFDEYCRSLLKKSQGADRACVQAAADVFGVRIIELHSSDVITFIEFLPNSLCRKVIYLYAPEGHVDLMCPRADFQETQMSSGGSISGESSGAKLLEPPGGATRRGRSFTESSSLMDETEQQPKRRKI